MVVEGYELLGEKYGQVYYERVIREARLAAACARRTSVARDGRVIRVHFQVPVPPLVWEDTFQRRTRLLSRSGARQGFRGARGGHAGRDQLGGDRG